MTQLQENPRSAKVHRTTKKVEATRHKHIASEGETLQPRLPEDNLRN
jgi:hypothetical protein